MANNTAVTAEPEVVTAVAEAPTEEAETETQNDTARFDKVEIALAQAEEAIALAAQLKRERDEALEKASSWETNYKKFQAKNTQKLQRLSDLEIQMRDNKATRDEILEIRRTVQNLATQLLPEDMLEKDQLEREREQIRREREALTASQTQDTPVSGDTQEQRKENILHQYFRNTVLSADDPRLDFADPDEEPTFDGFMSRLSASVLAAEREDAGKKVSMEAEALGQAAVEQALSAEETARQKIADMRVLLEQEKEDFKEQTRVAKEEKLRSLGADVADTARPEGEGSPRRLSEEIPINEKDLIKFGDPRGMKELEKRLDARRAKIRAGFNKQPVNQ